MPDGSDPIDPPPGKPRGTALRLTDEQIAAMAQVDAGDAVYAENLWRLHAPKWAKGLLQAERETD